jgi:glutathione S-transferase
MNTSETILVGRSSSHFSRTARIFGLELGVPFAFRPVFDLTTLDPAAYGGNPALKIPVLIDGQGPLYGAENICREFVRRGKPDRPVILRGDVGTRIVANAEEMVLHAMGAGVAIITLEGPEEGSLPPKVRGSLVNALAFLEDNVEAVLAALPAERSLSFCETTLFCLLTHLPFRKLMDVSGYPRLLAFCQRFAERPSARATEYKFDAA